MYRGFLSGRRTGAVRNNTLLVKDDDGFDNIDSFWENTASANSATLPAIPPKSSKQVTPKPALKSAVASPDDPSPTKKLSFHESSFTSDGGRDADNDDDDGSSFFNDDAFDDVSMPYDTTSPANSSPPSSTSRKGSSSIRTSNGGRSSIGDSSYGGNDFGDNGAPFSEEEETEEEDEDANSPVKTTNKSSTTPTSSVKKSGKNKHAKEVHTTPMDSEDEDDEGRAIISDGESAKKRTKLTHIVSAEREDSGGSRRSKRSKFPPLAYWKNERYVYERTGEGISEVLPIVAGISERTKTPVPVKRKPSKAGSAPKKTEIVDMSRVIKDRGILKSDKSKVWNDREQAVRKTRVICRAETMAENEHELPVTATRSSDEADGVGSAAQAFFTPPMSKNTPGWISGYVTLPPKAIKDAEGVGACNQVFFVAETHGKSLEVALALPGKDGQHVNFDSDSAQRYLLGSGDQFFVPPHNVYRLENHSDKQAAKLFWAIIKPVEEEGHSSEEESD